MSSATQYCPGLDGETRSGASPICEVNGVMVMDSVALQSVVLHIDARRCAARPPRRAPGDEPQRRQTRVGGTHGRNDACHSSWRPSM
jgi:hypothetical protein